MRGQVRWPGVQVDETMAPFDRHLQAAQGYLELGLPLEANEEIENIEPEMKTLSEVLAVRVEIFRVLGEWELMQGVARQLCHQRPDEPQPFISLAYATRRAVGLQEALAVLATVANRFPRCATILFNLACYAAQLGHLDSARARLAEAIKLDEVCRQMALAEPDLAALHGEVRASRQG